MTVSRTKDLITKVNDLEAKVNVLEETVDAKNNLISTSQQETRGIKAEMAAVNKVSTLHQDVYLPIYLLNDEIIFTRVNFYFSYSHKCYWVIKINKTSTLLYTVLKKIMVYLPIWRGKKMIRKLPRNYLSYCWK